MKDMMPNMKGYGNGYKPPSGNAGAEARGEYSHRSNPRPVPEKGSMLADKGIEANGDKQKVHMLQKEQARNESLRGYGC